MPHRQSKPQRLPALSSPIEFGREMCGDHIARWTAAGLMEAEKKFRRVKGCRELPELARKLNPGLHSPQQVA